MRPYIPLGDLVTTPVRGMQVGVGPVCIVCLKGVGGSGSGECLCLACYKRICVDRDRLFSRKTLK